MKLSARNQWVLAMIANGQVHFSDRRWRHIPTGTAVDHAMATLAAHEFWHENKAGYPTLTSKGLATVQELGLEYAPDEA